MLENVFKLFKPKKLSKRPVLLYLFEAEYYDGRIYKQTSEDISVKFPPTVDEEGELQGRGAGADIQEDLDNNLINKVSLVGKGNRITVDLQTGLFEINGLKVILESEKLPALPEHFKLIRYHQVSQSANVTYALKTGDTVAMDVLPEFREYFIGWECEVAGKRYEQKIAVA